MGEYFKRVQQLTQTRFWINNVSRGEAQLAIGFGAVGCTQNPAYVWKMLNHTEDSAYARETLLSIMSDENDDNLALVKLQRKLVSEVAKYFLPIYEHSKHEQGYVSIQGNPFNEDLDSIVNFGRFNREAGPNIMIKIPATENGIEAIRILAKEGLPINATECMAIRQVLDVCDAYQEATKDLLHPAPLYFSVITGIFDEYMQGYADKHNIDIDSDILWKAGMTVAKKIYTIVKERDYPCKYISGGARGLHHFTEMVGADAAVTINWVGTADKLLELDGPVTSRFLEPVSFSAVDMLTEKLEDFRKAYFINSIEPKEYEDFGPVVLFRTSFEKAWKNALNYIQSTRSELNS